MPKTVIPIFLSSDDNYAPYVATTIASICDNTKSFCEFYILDGGITEENKGKICELKKQFDNFSIEFIKIDVEKEFRNIDYRNACTYVSISTYNRFLVPNLKPHINKTIYLDVDIILKGDIAELYNQSLDNLILGAIPDPCKDKVYLDELKNKLGLNSNSKYFNAGVLLIDCNKWRNSNITDKLLDIESKYRDKLEMADQDVLNICFENHYKMLNEKFNEMFNEENDSSRFILRHFSGVIKPWQADFYIHYKTKKPCRIPDVDLFWEYAKMTSFYDNIIETKRVFLESNLLYKRFNNIVNKEINK